MLQQGKVMRRNIKNSKVSLKSIKMKENFIKINWKNINKVDDTKIRKNNMYRVFEFSSKAAGVWVCFHSIMKIINQFSLFIMVGKYIVICSYSSACPDTDRHTDGIYLFKMFWREGVLDHHWWSVLLLLCGNRKCPFKGSSKFASHVVKSAWLRPEPSSERRKQAVKGWCKQHEIHFQLFRRTWPFGELQLFLNPSVSFALNVKGSALKER